MKLSFPFPAAVLVLTLAACGENNHGTTPGTTGPDVRPAPGDHSTMEHTAHVQRTGVVGHATGIIKSVGSEGDFLIIEHGPIDSIGMDAMTMGFNTQGDVDLSKFAAGDRVAFMFKQGRDHAYRISAICNTDSDGADCLDDLMDH